MQEDLRVKHTLEEIHFTFFFFSPPKVNLNSFKTVRPSQAEIRARHKRANSSPGFRCPRLVFSLEKDRSLLLAPAPNFRQGQRAQTEGVRLLKSFQQKVESSKAVSSQQTALREQQKGIALHAVKMLATTFHF